MIDRCSRIRSVTELARFLRLPRLKGSGILGSVTCRIIYSLWLLIFDLFRMGYIDNSKEWERNAHLLFQLYRLLSV